MKKIFIGLLCILLLLCGCSKNTESLSFDKAEAYVVDFSDEMLVLHPKGTSPDIKIKIEIDTTSMDIVMNDGFIISGTAEPQNAKIPYSMDKDCIVSQMFKADSIDISEEVLYLTDDYIVINVSRRNIKVYCDGSAYITGDYVNVKGIAQKITEETIFKPDGDLDITYEMHNATVSKAEEITE